MNTDQELFESAMATTGGALCENKLEERARIFYADASERARDLIKSAREAIPKLPPIHFDFVANGQINAVAFGSEGRYFIGLHSGTLFMLRLVIGRMLSDPDILQQIGQSSIENRDLGQIEAYVPNADVVAKTCPILAPNDTVRAVYADFLTDQALMFIVGHEIAHISLGHVDYLREEYGLVKAHEIAPTKPASEKAKFERQCLELHADQRSILSRVQSLRDHLEAPDVTLPWVKVLAPDCLVRSWSPSIGIVFRLFGDMRFTHAQIARTSYPPIGVRRQFNEAAAVWAAQRQWGGNTRLSMLNAVTFGRMDTDLAFEKIFGEPKYVQKSPGLPAAGYLHPVAQEHIMRIQEYARSTLYGKLKPFSFEHSD